MNTDNKILYSIVALAVLLGIASTFLRPSTTTTTTNVIMITVTPPAQTGNRLSDAVLPSLQQFLAQNGGDIHKIAQAIDESQAAPPPVTPEPVVALPTASAPFVQPPLPTEEGVLYNIAIQEHPQFGRLVLVENTWFQCRKVGDIDHFDEISYPPGVWFTDKTDRLKWPTLRPSARKIIVDTCKKE